MFRSLLFKLTVILSGGAAIFGIAFYVDKNSEKFVDKSSTYYLAKSFDYPISNEHKNISLQKTNDQGEKKSIITCSAFRAPNLNESGQSDCEFKKIDSFEWIASKDFDQNIKDNLGKVNQIKPNTWDEQSSQMTNFSFYLLKVDKTKMGKIPRLSYIKFYEKETSKPIFKIYIYQELTGYLGNLKIETEKKHWFDMRKIKNFFN